MVSVAAAEIEDLASRPAGQEALEPIVNIKIRELLVRANSDFELVLFLAVAQIDHVENPLLAAPVLDVQVADERKCLGHLEAHGAAAHSSQRRDVLFASRMGVWLQRPFEMSQGIELGAECVGNVEKRGRSKGVIGQQRPISG